MRTIEILEKAIIIGDVKRYQKENGIELDDAYDAIGVDKKDRMTAYEIRRFCNENNIKLL